MKKAKGWEVRIKQNIKRTTETKERKQDCKGRKEERSNELEQSDKFEDKRGDLHAREQGKTTTSS